MNVVQKVNFTSGCTGCQGSTAILVINDKAAPNSSAVKIFAETEPSMIWLDSVSNLGLVV